VQAKDYIQERTEGYSELESAVGQYTPERVKAVTGVDPAQIEKMAELYAANHPATLLYAMGITQHSTGVDNVNPAATWLALRQRGSAKRRRQSSERQNNVQGPATWAGSQTSFQGISR